MDVRINLFEAYSNALNRLAKSREGRKAIDYWEPLVTTRSGQEACIDAAKAGENDARMFLFIKSTPQLGSSLKKFLGPEPRNSYARQRNGEDEEFVDEAMVKFDDAIKKYNYTKVAKGKDLINDVAMWMMNATSSMGSIINRAGNRGYMTGNITKKNAPTGPVRVSSLDTHLEVGGDDADIASPHSVDSHINNLDAWESFVEDEELDFGKNPTLRALLKYFLVKGDFDVNAAADTFGKTNMTIRTKLTGLKDILNDHSITYEDLGKLLHSVGSEALGAML